VRTAIEVALFFQPKGIHRHGGATTIRGAALDASARSVVDGEVLALRASVLLDKVIEQVIGECRGGAAVGAGSDVYIYWHLEPSDAFSGYQEAAKSSLSSGLWK
jgi:hypothetical protein